MRGCMKSCSSTSGRRRLSRKRRAGWKRQRECGSSPHRNCEPGRSGAEHDDAALQLQDVALLLAGVADFLGERAQDVDAEAAQIALIERSLEVRRRRGQRIERVAVVD